MTERRIYVIKSVPGELTGTVMGVTIECATEVYNVPHLRLSIEHQAMDRFDGDFPCVEIAEKGWLPEGA